MGHTYNNYHYNKVTALLKVFLETQKKLKYLNCSEKTQRFNMYVLVAKRVKNYVKIDNIISCIYSSKLQKEMVIKVKGTREIQMPNYHLFGISVA